MLRPRRWLMAVAERPRRPLRFHPFELDTRSGELRKHGRKVRLQEKPLRLLELLLEHPADVVTREEVRQRLWSGDTFVDFDAGLNTAVNKLRTALGDSAEQPQFVETLGRRGYRFIAALEPAAEDGTPAPATVAEPPSPESEPMPAAAEPAAGPRWQYLILAGFLLLALAWVGLRSRDTASRPVRSLAVLPLVNLTGDPQQEYFADGMTDALITDLASIRSLRVISRQSVMRFKGSRDSMPEIGRQLDVDAIIEGTVVRSGGRVRVTAQLVRAATDRHLWARSFERELLVRVAPDGHGEVRGGAAREAACARKRSPLAEHQLGGGDVAGGDRPDRRRHRSLPHGAGTGSRYYQARVGLADLYVLKGMREQALAELRQADASSGGAVSTRASLAAAYAKSGRKDEALEIVAELVALSKTRYASSVDMAYLYAGLGDTDRAFEWLERAYAERAPASKRALRSAGFFSASLAKASASL